MRIAQIVTRRQRRGAEVFATQLSDELVHRGHDVLLVGVYEPPPDPLLAAPAVAIADLPGARDGRLSLTRTRALLHVLQEFRPDLVQANGSDTLKYAALAKRLARPRWPLVYRNISIASRWLRHPLHALWGRFLLRQVESVAAVSDQSRDDFLRTYRLPLSRVETIPIGTPIPPRLDREAARSTLRREADLPPDAQFLIHVGSFSPEKNHAMLVEGFARLRREHPRAYLILIGDGPLLPEIRARIDALGLSPFVALLGSRRDAADLLAAADLFLLPSRVEGLPGVLLEAAARAVPAVATDVGSVREVVVDHQTGRLVPPDDLDRFVNAVQELLADGSARDRFGLAARELVARHYDLEQVITSFERLYLRLAGRQRRDPEATFEAGVDAA